jgi:uncharacterized membrane protein required for colicin V production
MNNIISSTRLAARIRILAFIAGHIREIPFYRQLIDCSFGIIGLVPLTICYRKIEKLEKLTRSSYLIS